MAIRILSTRLANQIAAGEVVERPASVVKELVENSIDACATRIEVDIEKGGRKLIRIRDNGCGIKKGELELALSRHATSKIYCLDDLEAITSLGFRGEALASISSVSRLTLTSRTEMQAEAWSAYAEGRNMSVQVKPAAHPVGTTVEVVDLFFNTPARRKFLRTDKTEFSHITELLKRIVLSRFDVAVTLRHNGIIIRQYRAASNDVHRKRRLAVVCGSKFIKTSVQVSLEHLNLSFHGWICLPEGARVQNDIQYCFVNQRMVKDKLINHAIRQGYESMLKLGQFVAYVLYIDIDPHQVDVNVHPTKHEVRFHQSRLVHDFIYQAVSDALQQIMASDPSSLGSKDEQDIKHFEGADEDKQPLLKEYSLQSSSVLNLSGAQLALANNNERCRSTTFRKMEASYSSNEAMVCLRQDESSYYCPRSSFTYQYPSNTFYSTSPSPAKAMQLAYSELIINPDKQADHCVVEASTVMSAMPVGDEYNSLGKALTIIASHYLLVQRTEGIALLDLDVANYLLTFGQLHLRLHPQGLKAQPLLIPQTIPASIQEIKLFEKYDTLLRQFGIVLRKKSSNHIMVMAVCQPFRQHNLQHFISQLLFFLSLQADKEIQLPSDDMAIWLADKATKKSGKYGFSQAVTLVTELEYCWQGKLAEYYSRLVRPVDVAAAIEAFLYD
ncbi:DNA mismatch repair endonuclease MutL [Candidatus Enterovibrio escicola]|uniref:DNA mismatch repair endonuclease MutL n=1 Tax=Candidatus Enterovibrio escicola TaxID=1927127 RepID=UPI001237CA3B|nr:DNA mismatch repair endonuclease MutL [Candidatus Enterovibrio escacola]